MHSEKPPKTHLLLGWRYKPESSAELLLLTETITLKDSEQVFRLEPGSSNLTLDVQSEPEFSS